VDDLPWAGPCADDRHRSGQSADEHATIRGVLRPGVQVTTTSVLRRVDGKLTGRCGHMDDGRRLGGRF
jgi:hypothetical protein